MKTNGQKFHMNQTNSRYLHLIEILRTHLLLNRGTTHNRRLMQATNTLSHNSQLRTGDLSDYR
jgi:hypothetical protein